MLYWHHCHSDVRDCDLGAQEGLGLLGTGSPAPCGPEPLDLQEEGQGPCRWLQVRLGARTLLFIFSSSHLELPVGAEVPSHCHPLGPGLVFQDLFFFACSISEIEAYPFQ